MSYEEILDDTVKRHLQSFDDAIKIISDMRKLYEEELKARIFKSKISQPTGEKSNDKNV